MFLLLFCTREIFGALELSSIGIEFQIVFRLFLHSIKINSKIFSALFSWNVWKIVILVKRKKKDWNLTFNFHNNSNNSSNSTKTTNQPTNQPILFQINKAADNFVDFMFVNSSVNQQIPEQKKEKMFGTTTTTFTWILVAVCCLIAIQTASAGESNEQYVILKKNWKKNAISNSSFVSLGKIFTKYCVNSAKKKAIEKE